MKEGRELQDVAAEILRQHKSKRDYVADTRRLSLLAIEARNGPVMRFDIDGKPREYAVTPLCLDQIGERVGIPRKYVERMAKEAPGLLTANVNHWFQNSPEKRMLRTFDNGEKVARAFLSERYRPLDNHDLAGAVLPHLTKAGCEVKSCELTESRLYIQAVTPRLEAVIQRRKAEAPNEHVIGAIADRVQAGVTISNSEVGSGSIRVEPLVWVLRCRNGMIVCETLRRHHVGRNTGFEDVEEAREFFTDETRALDDRAFWSKVTDVVRASLDEARFQKTVEKLSATTGKELGNPVDVVELTVERFGLSDGEGENILQHLCKGADLSQYGLIQAVTRTAEDCESYDRAVELERFGGQILELPASEFSKN